MNNTRLTLAAAGIALLALMLIALHHSRTSAPAAQSADDSPAASRSVPPDGEALLPFTPTQISQAAALAARFTTAYASHRYGEPPSVYLARLTPMMSPQLRPVIERAATDPVALTQRRRLQEITTAQARTTAIRALGPTSITFLVHVTQNVAIAHANRADTSHYALTLNLTHATDPDPGDGDADGEKWKVYALELASTGNAGQTAELTVTPDPAP
ncbi:hypothetical protein GCM10027176_51930 [Actinoallomurus bryophytorum]|uniref:Mce-associated membrane protein n=1 Tax=Actinoallomurus bryophytorum TaxID=1490222 RepID=A0A543CHS9_9ACTN|nr:hypothetical protein [Actinoallomurus bryophytorum]TQL96570.1 hypothetical protein FB559_2109 [Actinoallomurus bryophytorum]